MKLGLYDVIILDCDGVVFDSNLLKVTAFNKATHQYNADIAKEFSTYFKNNFGVSRYHLAKVFIEDFLKIDFDVKLYNKILFDYGDSCVKLYKEVDYTYKFIDFISFYVEKDIYIASGSDEKELNNVFIQRNIYTKFKRILGSPISKIELVRKIIEENHQKRIVMIGDAKSDFLASKDSGIDFIYMKQYSSAKSIMNKLVQKHHFSTINNLGELV